MNLSIFFLLWDGKKSSRHLGTVPVPYFCKRNVERMTLDESKRKKDGMECKDFAYYCHLLIGKKEDRVGVKKVSLVGSVVARFPSPAEQYIEPPLDLNEFLIRHPAATYFVRVVGDSMVRAGIHDADLLVVDRSLDPSDGDVVIACVDGDYTVKTFRKKGQAVQLEPANPAYPVIHFSPGHELQLFGKVTAVIHRL